MKDRHLVSNMRNQLHDLRDELIGVRMRIMPGSRTAAIERARAKLLEVMGELDHVLGGALDGDGPATPRVVERAELVTADAPAGDARK